MLLFRILVCVSATCFLLAFKRSGHFFKAFFITAAQGIAALFAVVLIGEFIPVPLGINLFTLGAGALGGTPVIILLVLLNTVLCGG